jgi:hypothetical protein
LLQVLRLGGNDSATAVDDGAQRFVVGAELRDVRAQLIVFTAQSILLGVVFADLIKSLLLALFVAGDACVVPIRMS